MEKKERILIVDDDKILSEHLKAGLVDENYHVVSVNKGSNAIELAKHDGFNLAILDLVLPDIQGIELMRSLNRLSPHTNFIILTGYATVSSAIEALKVGAYDYLIKPFDMDHLKLVIRRGLEKQRLTVKNIELVEQLEKEKIKLEIIMDAYNHIGEIFRLDDLADFVSDRAVQIVEAERASLMIVDEGAGELVVRGFKGAEKEKKGLRMKIGQLVAGWVAQEGEAMLVRDIETDPRMKLQLRNSQYKTKSFISLPLKADHKVVGVINVTDKLAEMDVFTEEDLRYLSLLAHQTVIQIENIRLCEKLSSLAVTDALTGIFNHRYFQEGLNIEILRAQRYLHALSLIIFDIDGFKSYNDQYGHQEGDRVLKHVSQEIRKNVRQVDVICRYGGDEFVVILPSTNVKGAKFVADKIRASVASLDLLNVENHKVIRVTISGGVAEFKEGMHKEELINLADRALYKAKSEGKNRILIAGQS
jgi:diguanylate cyclase (GGDEF)-like protein